MILRKDEYQESRPRLPSSRTTARPQRRISAPTTTGTAGEGTTATSISRYLPPWRDVVVAVAVGAAWLAAIALARSAGWYPESLWAYRLTGLLAAVIILTRRRLPALTFVTTVAFYTARRPEALSAAEFLLAPMLLAAWSAVASRRLRWWIVLPPTLWVSLLLFWPWSLDLLLDCLRPPWTPSSPFWTLDFSRLSLLAGMAVGTVALAAMTARQRALTDELRRHNDELERLRDVEAGQVVAAERTRIARELHDVVAHHMSAVVLRAQAADRVADTDPDQPREAVRWIAGTGQDALTAMRHVVRVLRTGSEDPRLHPDGGLADLPAIAERLGAVGLRVELPADTPTLPLAHDLTAARIVQESLTNALVHGRATRARVEITKRDDGTVEVIVDDDGKLGAPSVQTPVSRSGGGNGIVGIRERVARHDGTLRLEPSAWGGWRIRAVLRPGGAQ